MKRILTALVLLPIITYVIIWAPWPAFLAVLTTVAMLCFWEYRGIASAHGFDPPGPAAFAAGLLFLLLPIVHLITLTLGLIIIALVLALRVSDLKRYLPSAASFLFGILYIFASWRCARELHDLGSTGPKLLFFAIALNWIGDTAAFYVGRSLGRHKLAPRVSPAKSWEGAIASVIGSVAFGALYVPWVAPGILWWHAALIAAAGNMAGQLGDLCESAMKRGAGVKDSGTLLPGHGGWLDRVDSTLFAVPVVYGLILNFERFLP